MAQGKQEKAQTLIERELKKLEKKNHKHVWEYADYLEAKAMVYLAKKDFRNGEALLVESARNRKENLGATHPAVAQSLRTLATRYERSDQRMKAEALLLQVTEMTEKSRKCQKRGFLKVILVN